LPRGFVTFVATKVTKKAFSRKASLPHQALPANQAKPRAVKFCSTAFALANASANITMPLPHSFPPLFCLISPEAVLLTLKKMSAGLTEKRAGVGGNAGLAFAMRRARKKR
jgi:hypothetical protein